MIALQVSEDQANRLNQLDQQLTGVLLSVRTAPMPRAAGQSADVRMPPPPSWWVDDEEASESNMSVFAELEQRG